MKLAETQLSQMVKEMVRIRRIEEKIATAYADQQMRCPVHLSIGQEAVAVGVAYALKDEDCMFSTHRAHAHYLARGGNLKKMIAELYGKATGCTGGKGGSMHLIDREVGFLGSTPIVGSSFPLAVGSALATKMNGGSEMTVVFMGEGMAEEGVFSESLNYAALMELPVLFVCENNLYSVYTPLDQRQSEKRSQSQIAQAHGLSVSCGDGNDVEQVYELTKSAREEGGPHLLELTTYRWREHCGPNYDNDIGYRTEKEFLEWKKICPIERHLDLFEEDGSIEKEIAAAFEFARISPFPEPASAKENLYA